MTTDDISLTSKPFFSKNCFSLSKMNSLVTQQLSPKVFPSKNLANTDSCFISFRSQDESVASNMASAFFKLVRRLETHNSTEASTHLVAVLATVAHALLAPQPFSWFS